MSSRRAAPLVLAKQVVPPVRTGSVHRARLHAPLLDGAGPPLTVVVAPAGWGKTTLLAQWAHDPAEARGVAWVSLDAGDDEPVRFWTYVLTALSRAIPALTRAPLDGLLAPGLDPVDLAVPTLLNELSALDTAHVLVLDDYHVLTHRGIHESVEFLIGYLPPALRVVVAARWDPPLPLARLRARQQLTELRAADLGFTAAESAALLGAVSGSPPDESTALAARERTAGWAAGLQLTALRQRGRAWSEPVAGAPDHHILDYLSAEVLADLPAERRDLLVRTSVLDRLSGPLCDDVLERTGSAALLDRCDRDGLFVAALDAHREWYGCHSLFRDALRRVLDAELPGEAARIRSRAAAWFLARGYRAEAVELRIAADDQAGAAALLRSSVPDSLERGMLAAHLHLGRRLATATVRDDPRLAVSLAWAAGLSGRFSAMAGWLDLAEPRIDEHSPTLDGWRTLRGAAATVRAVAVSVVHADVDAALALARRGVELEDDPDLIGHVMAHSVLAAMLVFADRCAEAVPLAERAWARARALGLPPVLGLQAAGILASALSGSGRHAALRRLLAEANPAADAAEQRWGVATVPGIVRLRTIEGRLAHHDGDPATARATLRRAAHLARTFAATPALVDALCALAEVELDAADRVAAREALREARDAVDEDAVLPFVADRLRALEQRLGRDGAPRPPRPVLPVEELTDRERAVLRALTGTATQREIGAALYLSINTVKGYTKVLYRKLGVSSRGEAVRAAKELDLL